MHTAFRRVHTSNVMRLGGSFAPTNIPRCARPTPPSRQQSIPHNALLLRVRHFHLASLKNIFRPKDAESSGMSDTQEEVAKAAILEKVMKGRQLTDLMLRCAFLPYSTFCFCAHTGIGTILDHAGTLSFSQLILLFHERVCAFR
jgi:magnesium transporter